MLRWFWFVSDELALEARKMCRATFIVAIVITIGALMWTTIDEATARFNKMHDPTFWQPSVVVHHRV